LVFIADSTTRKNKKAWPNNPADFVKLFTLPYETCGQQSKSDTHHHRLHLHPGNAVMEEDNQPIPEGF